MLKQENTWLLTSGAYVLVISVSRRPFLFPFFPPLSALSGDLGILLEPVSKKGRVRKY